MKVGTKLFFKYYEEVWEIVNQYHDDIYLQPGHYYGLKLVKLGTSRAYKVGHINSGYLCKHLIDCLKNGYEIYQEDSDY